jgi:uncharacterized protein (TIGR03437 family)
MKLIRTLVCVFAVLCCGRTLDAQVTFNPKPARVVGQNWLVPKSAAPNLVEGREFYLPQSLAIDAMADPPILYVSDTYNHRVLAWRDASKAGAGAFADLVIGQRDKFSTSALGPGTTLQSGLTMPTGLAVDRYGNLYVVDCGNNRILRFPRPFDHPDDLQIPDLVLGQKNLDSEKPNSPVISANTIAVNINNNVYRASLVFDGYGNLYFTDAGNNRVLRYPASALGSGATNGPDATLVLGQPDFVTRSTNPLLVDGLPNKLGPNAPGGLALDARGNLYVSGTLGTGASTTGLVFVYSDPARNAQPAARILGLIVTTPGTPAPSAVNEIAFSDPEGIVLIGDSPAVVDTGNNRILIFDPIEKWPAETATFSPPAKWVIGQKDISSRKIGAGATGLFGPVHAVFYNSELYVVDSGNHRVIVFPQQAGSSWTASRVVGQLNFDGNGPNLVEGKELYLVHPTLGGRGGMVIDDKSDPPRLYIADTFNNRILGYRDARRIKTGDAADLVIGQLDLFRVDPNYPWADANTPSDSGLFLPTGVAVDANGDLFVADSGNARVLRFPKPFNQQAPRRANLVLGQLNYSTRVTDASARTMAAPYGLAFTPDNHLLVSDSAHSRVLLFRRPAGGDFSNGMTASAVFGQPDFVSTAVIKGDPNSLNGPRGIATDTSARLYVCDTGNNRVVVYRAVTEVPAPTSPAVTLSGMRGPASIYVSSKTGEIWVTDTLGNRALRYPEYSSLPVNNFQPNGTIASGGPLAVSLDTLGNLWLAEGYNRVAVYYPAMSAVNAASYLRDRALAPGTIASAFPAGSKFGSETKSFNELPNPVPLPKTLADTQLLINDAPVPLYFVSPGQINFLVPMNAPASGTVDLLVTRASTGEILASGTARMDVASPALFTAAASGTGQVAALNQDNTVNGPSNPVARGQVIQLFGTGQGFVSGAPADGDVATGLIPTSEKPKVWIEPDFVPDDYIQYSGLAPNLIGVWQINVKIPDKVAPGNRVMFVEHKSIASSTPQIRTLITVK